MTLEATLRNASLPQLAEALLINAEKISHELEQSPPGRVGGRDTASDRMPAIQTGGNETTERRHPHTPELSRIAWAASSRIDSARNQTRPIYRLPPEILAVTVEFYQSEDFENSGEFGNSHRRAYGWIRLMLVSRLWKATILSFPSIWSKLVMNTSVSRLDMLTIVERSGSHPLQVVIPPILPDATQKSLRYKHVDLVVGLLPRITHLVIAACSAYSDAFQICRAFEGRPADQLRWFNFTASPVPVELFTLYPPRLTSLYLTAVKSWPAPIAENITHIRLGFWLNPETLERDLKRSPRLEQIRIDGVDYVSEHFRNHSRISLTPGTQLIIKDSEITVASLFSLGPTNYLSITKTVPATNSSVTSFLELTLPHDISCFRNLDGLTGVHLELIDSGEDSYTHRCRTVTVVLRCFTADCETLHISLEYSLSSLRSPNTVGTEIIPERPPAMRALNYLRPLDLGKVVELRMEGFVGEWGLQTFELYRFLQRVPALRHIKTGDDNKVTFWSALSTVSRSTSVIVEGV